MIEPPCTDRYARWCERSAGLVMVSLLLDFKAIHNAKNTLINWVVIEMRASACSFFAFCGGFMEVGAIAGSKKTQTWRLEKWKFP